MTTPLLLLWDIDGTLLGAGPGPRQALEQALAAVYAGVDFTPQQGYRLDGKTDPQILRELAVAAGVTTFEPRLAGLLEAYLGGLAATLAASPPRVYPGVGQLLDLLARDGRFRQILLTGNLERGARLKLAAAGLNGYFATGAFGSDDADRLALPPVALARAATTFGCTFPPERALVIGDSERDIATARGSGLRVLAVATGRTSSAELTALGADWVLDDLANTAAVLELLYSIT